MVAYISKDKHKVACEINSLNLLVIICNRKSQTAPRAHTSDVTFSKFQFQSTCYEWQSLSIYEFPLQSIKAMRFNITFPLISLITPRIVSL